MKIAELARRAGVAASAVRFYEETAILPAPPRLANGYREYGEADLARLSLVVALRRLGLAPVDAGRLAGVCVERGAIDRDLVPLIAAQREAVERQRADLDRLDSELTDLELTIEAAGRARRGDERAAVDGRAAVAAEPIRVLFVCTGNSARSQIAEALLAEFGGSDFVVFSAGTEPRPVRPETVSVLGEIGIDWSGARSKSAEEFVGQPFDYVITVCDRARQTCPVFPGDHNSLHWGLDDPAEADGTDAQKLQAFRRTRTEVATRLRPFVELARRARRQPVQAA
jgi:arsenate reductase (thioredoxin)